jgi:hypothetical protein
LARQVDSNEKTGAGDRLRSGRWLWRVAAVVIALALAVFAAWLFRVQLLTVIASDYFESHGVSSSIEITRLDQTGLSVRIALGDKDHPTLGSNDIEVLFNKDSWIPEVIEVRIEKPVLRAHVDAHGVSFPPLQSWIKSLRKNLQSGTRSRFVSDDLSILINDALIIADTPDGTIEWVANLRVRHGHLTFARLTTRPVTLVHDGRRSRIDSAVVFARLTSAGYSVEVYGSGEFAADESNATLHITGLNFRYEASGAQWHSAPEMLSLTIPKSHLIISATELREQDISAVEPRADLALTNLRVGPTDKGIVVSGDLQTTSSVRLPPDQIRRELDRLAIFQSDRALENGLVSAASTLSLAAAAHVEEDGEKLHVRAWSPWLLQGADSAALRFDAFDVSATSTQGFAALSARLSGPHVPALGMQSRNFTWTRSQQGLTFGGPLAIQAFVNFGALHGASLSAVGTASFHNGNLEFDLDHCAPIKLAEFRSGRGVLADHAAGAICPTAGVPLLVDSASGWKLAGRVSGLSLNAPSAPAKLRNISGPLVFEGRTAELPSGLFHIATMSVSDAAHSPRFNSISGIGDVTLSKKVWQGQVAIMEGKLRQRIGLVKFSHATMTGTGSAVIDVPSLSFAPGKLEPADLSPLLVPFRRADGSVRFSGVVSWTRNATTSRGLLSLQQFNFANPIGMVHLLHSQITLKSLLPPITESGQRLDVARIDWTLPITNTTVTFSATPTAVRLDMAKADVAGGSVSLDPIDFPIPSAASLSGIVKLSQIELSQIVSALNIGDKIKIDGKITGVVPFVSGTNDIRIVDGYLDSVGPGHLSIDRTIWTKGSLTVNGVQDFAYQALEHLAYESLSARINSVANGRLQIVFHIKGRNDPPKPQEARIGVIELLRGRAFDKPVPLPSGTPIELTLDSSLNFDELLRSYRDAWSNSRVQDVQSH